MYQLCKDKRKLSRKLCFNQER